MIPIGDKTVDEGGLLQFAITATDPDGDSLTFGYSGWMNSATYTVNYDDAGTRTVIVTVSDGELSDSCQVTIIINNVNRPPALALIGDKSVDEAELLTFEVTASDSDTEDTISYTVRNLPEGAGFVSPAFNWTPGYDQAGSYSVAFIATDSYGDSDSEMMTITVNNVNRPPVLDPIADITVNEKETITITPTATDPDEDSLTFSYSGWMNSSTYTVNYDDAGTRTVIVTVSDGDLSDSCQVTIRVNDILSSNIARPDSGDRFSGNAVIMEAITQAEDISVDFYYKSSDTTTWRMIGTGISLSPTHRVHWNTDGLEDGSYSLKAVTKSGKGDVDLSPPEIRVAVDHQDPDYIEGRVKKDEWSVIGNEGGPRVEVPAGALDDDTVLRISKPDPGSLPIGEDNSIGLYIEIALESGQEVLNGPVAISMPYRDDDNNGIVDGTDIDENNLKLNLYHGTTREELPTSIDIFDNIATATTDHFTIFGLFGALSSDLDNLLVYPNPFRPGRDDAALKFLNLTPNSTIRIYNVAGELVSLKEDITTGAAHWDGRNDHGRPVASGGYFYIITDDEKGIKKGKIAVIW